MDIENFYIEKGSGEPLILLHGNGEDSSYFLPQIDEFSKYYHVYAVDTRGHGKTERGTKEFTIGQFADDLSCFMKLHKIEKANILGFSDGGNIALVFALNYPEKINKLILYGANLMPNGVKTVYQLPIVIEYYFSKICSVFSKNAGKKAELLRLMVKEPKIRKEKLTGILSKTLVIAGTNDMIKEEHTKTIADNIGNSSLVFLSGSHFVSKENPTEFNKTVLSFLLEKE